MLTRIEVGLVNGAMGTIEAICYQNGGPPDLPLAVMVRCGHYSGPTLHDGTVPIITLRRTWSNFDVQSCRLPLPLKLAWTVTIHKSQGLTLDKVVINIGKKEFSCWLTYMACSRVQQLTDLLFNLSFPFQQLSCLANNRHLHDRQSEDQRVLTMQPSSPHSTSPTSHDITPLLPPQSVMDSLPPTPTPPSSHSSTPPPLSPMDYLRCTPSPPSSCSSTRPPLSPMDYLMCTSSPPSSRSSTHTLLLHIDYLTCTTSPPCSSKPPPVSPK